VSGDAKFSWLIPLLGALTALGPLSNDLYVPSLPLVAEGLQTGGGAVQLTLSTILLGLSLGSLIYGPLSDQYGRRPILCLGLAVYVVASVIVGARDRSRPSRHLAVPAGAGRLVRQRARARHHLGSLEDGAGLAGAVVGGHGHVPVAGARARARGVCRLARLVADDLLAARGCRSAVPDRELLCAAGGAAPESRLWRRIAAYRSILGDGQALGYMACTGLGFVGVVAFVSNSSFVFIEYFGLAPHQYGYCFSAVMLGGSAGAYMNSRVVARLGITRLIGIGTLCMAVGGMATLLGVLAGAGFWGILVPAVLYMFGVGFLFSNSMARTLSRFPGSTGAASAVFGVNQYLIGALVAAGLSAIIEPTPFPLVLSFAGAGVSCAALWWLWLRRRAPVTE
jgi:DHA1 family bicyclomycin/chloramphenicol resistance-like MFS transporter